ncbi:hypothetical protein M8C21_017518, partial [Ambrosia artemisiifolia]
SQYIFYSGFGFKFSKRMADGLKGGDENELMLELSIGGIFGEPKKTNRNASESVETDDGIANRLKRKVQAVRRRELRRKREEKISEKVTDGFGSRKVVRVSSDGQIGVVINDEPFNMNEKPDEREADGGGPRICNAISNASGLSYVFSDAQCTSHQGVVTTDGSRSNTSNSQLDQKLASTSAASVGPYDQLPVNAPGTSIQHKEASALARMPCVSTTGNGPNGRTVSGFLYRYTKNEVTILCVCHGESFSPAGFVEHAGGVGIAHPLKHITIFPTAFAS